MFALLSGLNRLWLKALLVAGAVCLSASPAQAANRLALLVGCSVYPLDASIPALPGAENDVAKLQHLLRERFAFEGQNVAVLTGWPDDPTRRPTKSNIERAFADLAARAESGSNVFIYLAGHGDQRPVPESQTDLLDQQNPEPDGLDEVFVAADFAGGENAILDDQIGRWLDALSAKGAHVWIVFDACHSATLTRGDESRDETTRRIHSPGTDAERALTAKRVGKLPAAARELVAPPIEALDKPRAAGSVTAFYACQPFEKAKELYRPVGSAKSIENRRGLFSYHLEETLRAALGRRLSYRDLSRMLVARVRADLGSFAPTPAFDGDLDREVLGFATWPAPAIRLESTGGRLAARAGTLAGVTPDTLLAVYDVEDREFQRELGRVRVVSAGLTNAIVEPFPAGSAAPREGVCRIVERGLSEPPLRVGVASSSASLADETAEALTAAVERLKDSFGEAVAFVSTDADSLDATLTALPPGPSPGGLSQPSARIALVPGRLPAGGPAATTPIAIYPTLHAEALAEHLEADLRKMLVWRRFWRLADVYGEPASSDEGSPLRLEVRRVDASGEASAPAPSVVHPGDVLEASLRNLSRQAHHYSVFYLSSNYAIEHVRSQTIEGRSGVQTFREIPVDKMRVADKRPVLGAQGYIVVATPREVPPPELEFLAQPALGVFARTRASPGTAPRSAFARFLHDASLGRAATRDPHAAPAASPIVTTATWTVVDRRPPGK